MLRTKLRTPSETAPTAPSPAERVRPRTGRSMSEYRVTFARQLNLALDRTPGVPTVPLKRYRWVAERFDVGVTGVRKWFLAQALPAVDKLLELATGLGVSVQWLLFGEEKFVDLGKLADAHALQVRSISELAPVRGYQTGAEEEGVVHLALAPGFVRERLLRDYDGRVELALLLVEGPEMLPSLAPGEWVVFQNGAQEVLSERLHVVHFRMTATAVVRRVFKEPSGYRIACDNPEAVPREQFLSAVSVGAADSLGGGLVVVGPVVAILKRP